MASPLWVVTTYYNPQNYRARQQNFHTFRRFLTAPLLAVELSGNGNFQLTDQDSDMLIQLTGEDAIWQKERLINIGVKHLPDHVKYVAWVDCDVIFENPGWVADCIALFEKGCKVVQPFFEAIHMPHEWQPSGGSEDWNSLRRISTLAQGSFIDRLLKEGFSERRFLNNEGGPDGVRPAAPGFAWAAERAFLEKVKLFDLGITGGGDAMFVNGLLDLNQDRFQRNSGRMTLAHWDCYDRWCRNISGQIARDQIASLPQSLLHLWHGDLEQRHYLSRYDTLVNLNFDPARDLVLADNHTWAWADPQSKLAAALAAYFASREEDGPLQQEASSSNLGITA